MSKHHALTVADHFSYSQLNTFKTCREQYRITYINGIRKIDESVEAFMGKCVHETLEWLYRPKNLVKPYITFDRVCQQYDDVWLKALHEKIYISDNRYTTDYYYSVGKRCLANYYNQFGPTFEQNVLGTEVEIKFIIDDKYEFRGVIDRLDQPKPGIWEIHDYKTGKLTKTERAARNDIQLGMYQIAIEQNYEHVTEVSLHWHYLRKGREVRIVHDSNSLGKIKNKIIRSVKDIIRLSEDSGNFYPKESMLCNWCYLWQECSAKIGHNPARTVT